MFKLELKPGLLNLQQLRRIQSEQVQLSLSPDCLGKIEAATATVQLLLRETH